MQGAIRSHESNNASRELVEFQVPAKIVRRWTQATAYGIWTTESVEAFAAVYHTGSYTQPYPTASSVVRHPTARNWCNLDAMTIQDESKTICLEWKIAR